MCCTQLAENTGCKKIPKNSPSAHHHTTFSGSIFAIKAHINNWRNLLNSDIYPTCPHNMVNFGPLAAEIDSVVWGTPAYFNGFRVLAALLHGTVVVGISQTFRHWTEGPPIFSRANITLGIGPHSSSYLFHSHTAYAHVMYYCTYLTLPFS